MQRIPALVFVAAVALSGCTGSVSSPAPMPTVSPSSGLSVATQRAEAQTGISVTEGISVASLLASVLHELPLGGGTLPTGACTDGVETTIKVLNPEQLQVTIDEYYEASCKSIFKRTLLKTTYFPSGTLEMAGTSTDYDANGKGVAFATITANGQASTSSVRLLTTGSVSRTPTGPALFTYGLTCTFASKDDCGFGGIFADSSLAESFGVTATFDDFTGQGAAVGTVGLKGYGSALGKLKLKQGSGNAWTMSGGTIVASTTGTFDETVDAKSLNVMGTLKLKDVGNNASVSLDFGSRSGIENGHVDSLSPAAPYAAFGTDTTGTGSIQYSSGTAGLIIFFIITS